MKVTNRNANIVITSLLLVLLLSFQSSPIFTTYAATYNGGYFQASSLLSESPKVTIQSGTAGESTIYTNETSARVQVVTDLSTTSNSRALIAYRSNTGTNTLSSPKQRIWDGTAWVSQETEMETAGSPVRWVRTAYSPLKYRFYERIVVTLSDDGNLDAYVWTGSSWSATTNIGYVGTTANTYRAFDIAYETTRGNAMLVYGVSSTNTARDLAYKIWDGTQWSSEAYINDDGHSTDIQIWWVALASNPTNGSNEIGLLYIDRTDSDADAFIWDGINWGNRHELTGSTSINSEESIALAYEATSGNLMIVAGEGSLIRWNRWTGAWGTSATFDINTGATGAMNWLSLKADPASNRLMLVSVDASTDLCTASWNPTSWTVDSPHDTLVDTNAQRCADVEWEPTGSKVLMVYGTASASVSYKTWTPAGGWSGITTPANAGTHPWIQLRRNPRSVSGDVKILGATLNSNNDIFGFKWDGTTLTFEGTAFTADTTVVTYECFEIGFRRFGDPLDFDYVLKIVNLDTGSWKINLKLYDSQNINRLGNVTITFHDGSTSNQIIINNGVITQSEGSLYDLAESATTYIRIANPYVTASGTSYLFVNLKILYPNTSTYSQFIITFEIS